MFDKLRNKLKVIQSLDQNEILAKVFQNDGLKQQIIDWNQDQMYEQGIDAAGEPLGSYAPFTIKYKMEHGQRFDHVTLLDSGYFYSSMKSVPSSTGVLITADMQKPDVDLEQVYPKALGLTKESIGQMKPLVAQLMAREIKSRL